MATIRQKSLAKKLSEALGKSGKVKQKTLTKILEEAGYSKQTARTQQKKTIEQKGTQEALKEVGIDKGRLSKKFNVLLDAKKIQYCDIHVTNENGELKVNKSNDFIEVEDYNIQLQAAKFLAPMVGFDNAIDAEEINRQRQRLVIELPDGTRINA